MNCIKNIKYKFLAHKEAKQYAYNKYMDTLYPLSKVFVNPNPNTNPLITHAIKYGFKPTICNFKPYHVGNRRYINFKCLPIHLDYKCIHKHFHLYIHGLSINNHLDKHLYLIVLKTDTNKLVFQASGYNIIKLYDLALNTIRKAYQSSKLTLLQHKIYNAKKYLSSLEKQYEVENSK